MKRFFIILLLASLLSGCATTRNILYEKSARPAKPADYRVEIYDASGIHRPYRIIGVVIASTGPFHHFADAIEHLQDAAKEMGGDALIDLTQRLPQGTEMPAGGWFIFGNAGEIWSAKVIVWE